MTEFEHTEGPEPGWLEDARKRLPPRPPTPRPEWELLRANLEAVRRAKRSGRPIPVEALAEWWRDEPTADPQP